MKQIVVRMAFIVLCVSVLLSVFILPVSAYDEVQDKYIFELEGFPYHDNGNDANNYFAHGVFIGTDFNAYYYEFVGTSEGLFNTTLLPNDIGVYYINDTLNNVLLPSFYHTNTDYSSGKASFNYYLYDVNGNLVFSISDTAFHCGNKKGDFVSNVLRQGYPSYFNTNGMFLSIGELFYNELPVDSVLMTSNGYPSVTSVRAESLLMYPEILINGYNYNGSKAGVTLASKGNLEPVTDENGNITNYIFNNEIDISPIIDVQPSSPLNEDAMNDFESLVGEVQSTLPEEELSDMMDNVDMSGRPIEWIYLQLEDFVTGNNKVFAVYMAILSMSFIMFVLNKGSNVRG